MANVARLGGYGDTSGSGLMFRNKIINGGFDIWQRATSSTGTTGIVSADRWEVWQPNTNTARTAFTLGQTTVPGNPKYYITTTRTVAASSDNMILSQKIEFPESFSGQTVTASFWAKAASSKTIYVDFWAYMNGVEVLDSDQATINLTTSWQQFVFTITLPNFASGKTSAANDWIAFRFLELYTGFTTFTIDFAQVQVELGSQPTPFEQRPIGIELALCQRYYCACGAGSPGLFNAASTARFSVQFATSMRVAPTVTAIAAPSVYHPTVSEAQTGSQTTNFSTTQTGYVVTPNAHSKVQFGGFTSGVDGRPCLLLNDCLQASAEL